MSKLSKSYYTLSWIIINGFVVVAEYIESANQASAVSSAACSYIMALRFRVSWYVTQMYIIDALQPQDVYISGDVGGS